ncbi:hypothetical protein [Streptomyces nojiriensis]|uniref:hypothetical protein n=1 Tax=Streptomyces nojiriensis TaxID=66374 RepID=UPI0035E38F93
MDAVPIALKELETAWLTAADADGGRGVYDAALWTTLHPHLQTAHIAAAPDGSDGPGFTRGDLDLIAGRL